jgi:hypothetical protein
MTAIVDARNKQLLPVCIPVAVSNAQLVQIFVKVAESSPERLHEDALALVFDSIARSFPCQSNR